MALKINRQDDLDAIFGKFAEMNLDDDKRDKFLKHKKNDKDKKQKNEKRPEKSNILYPLEDSSIIHFIIKTTDDNFPLLSSVVFLFCINDNVTQ